MEVSAAPVEDTAAWEVSGEEALHSLAWHSVMVPPRLRQGLAGAKEGHLRYLARHYHVQVCHS